MASRLQQGGLLATRKDDFNDHISGENFRQTASTIDMNPAILGGKNVQDAINQVNNAILARGSGYISIGLTDGYSTLGDFNVGPNGYATLANAFTAALAHPRLANGGIILLLANTYITTTTITIPSGISIMGEREGTFILGQTTEQPIFICSKNQKNLTISGNSGSGNTPLSSGSNVDQIHISNLMLTDNLNGTVNSGFASMTTVPMVQCQISSNVAFENVSFLGRLNNGSLSGRGKTLAAIGYTTGGGTATTLTMKNCFIDGVKTAINFTPGHNDIDFLNISHCKFRTYGTEDPLSTGVDVNCCINMTQCNANIDDNYYVGAGTYTNTFINITTGTGTNVKVNITGTTGGPTTAASGNLVVNTSVSTFTSSIHSNNWGFFIDNPWYIVVGGASTNNVGDIFGSSAIDTILSLANTIPNFNATVIVNPGTYTITGNATSTSNYANLKFIGNKLGKSYPVFSLNLSSATTDSLGNRPLALGNHIESIEFNSIGHRHSIRPGFNPTTSTAQNAAGTLEVKDCIFINTTLHLQDLSTASTDVLGNTTSNRIEIKDCYFRQTGTFGDTFSMSLPVSENVVIDSCYFTGNGYAFNIGTGFSNNRGVNTVSISNVICDLTGFSISISNPIANSYVNTDHISVLKLSNCQIYADNQFTFSTPINAAQLTTPGTFSKFIKLKAIQVNVTDCVFGGPDQTFTSSAIAYAMPTVYVDAIYNGKISNCKFGAGGLPLQIGGSTLTDSDFSDKFIVENCSFLSASQTLLDFDLALPAANSEMSIVVNNCIFQGGSTARPVLHSTFTYSVGGIIQIFVGDAIVYFTNNTVMGSLSVLTATTINNFSGVAINAFTNTGTTGDQANTIHVENNSIYITNNFSIASISYFVSCVNLTAPILHVKNNTLAMYNVAGAGTNFIGCLYIDNQNTISTNYSDSIISGNVFSRRNIAGTSSNLRVGYIKISASTGSNRGLIINNSFDQRTYDGSTSAPVSDDSSGQAWTVSNNKNQTVSQLMLWSSGSHGVATSTDLGNAILANGVVSSSVIYATPTTANTIIFKYNNTGTQDQFYWTIPLQHLLPPSVTLAAVFYTYQASSSSGSIHTAYATMVGSGGTDTDTHTISDTSSHVNSITLSRTYSNIPTENLYLIVGANFNHSSSITLTITNVTVQYYW